MKKNSALSIASILAMGSIYSDQMDRFDLRSSHTKRQAYIPGNVKAPIPSGCNEYFFKEDGTFEIDRSIGSIFNCVATNDVNAIRKFNKFMNRKS